MVGLGLEAVTETLQVPVTWKVNVTKIQSWEGIEPRPSLNVVERATTPHPRIKLLILIFNKYLI